MFQRSQQRGLLGATPSLIAAAAWLEPGQVNLVRSSFAQAVARSPALGVQFYLRLAERNPRLAPILPTALMPQSEHLLAVLATCLNALANPDEAHCSFSALGAWALEADIGLLQQDQAPAAWIDTLAVALGPARFTAAHRRAWARLLQALTPVPAAPASDAGQALA